MKQTAVEWLYKQIYNEYKISIHDSIMEQAKEMEKQQQDDFAIEFAEWRVNDWVHDERWTKISDTKELLEIYKKEINLL
jgi:hypothetical protein